MPAPFTVELLMMRKIRHRGKWGEGDLSNAGLVPKELFEKRLAAFKPQRHGATDSMA